MRVLETVIFTDRLGEVRAFYEKHFAFPMDAESPARFGVLVFPEARLVFLDAALSGGSVTGGALVRIGLPFPELERARLLTEGVPCTDLIVEDWGSYYKGPVRCFTLTDPSGTRLQLFEDQCSRERQIISTGDGTDTRDIRRGQ